MVYKIISVLTDNLCLVDLPVNKLFYSRSCYGLQLNFRKILYHVFNTYIFKWSLSVEINFLMDHFFAPPVRVNYFELLWKIQAQGVIATLLCLPLWEYVWENKNSCFELFSTVTCNPPCEHGRCIDNTSNATKCYCVIGWEGQFCNKSNGGESTRSKQALAYKSLKLWMLQAMVFTCSADFANFWFKIEI